jgi:hypothetical protein
MPSSGILRRVALLRTDVSEDRSASIIMVSRISELRTTVLYFVWYLYLMRMFCVFDVYVICILYVICFICVLCFICVSF